MADEPQGRRADYNPPGFDDAGFEFVVLNPEPGPGTAITGPALPAGHTVRIVYNESHQAWLTDNEGDEDMHVLNGMDIEAKTTEVLLALRDNLEQHKKIVEEAKAGYLKKGEAALLERLGQFREGKIVSLSFLLYPSEDHSAVYETAIKMLELHVEDTINLNSAQVNHLMLDRWDWMGGFMDNAVLYSQTANEVRGRS